MTDTVDKIQQHVKQSPEFMRLHEQVLAIAKTLKPAQIKFANYVAAGMAQNKAYLKIKEEANTPVAPITAAGVSNRWMKHEGIKLYIEKMQEIAMLTTVKAVQYTEEDWMRNQISILDKALGREKIKKVILDDGSAYEADLHEDNLTQANRSQELIAKRFGWLQDNVNSKISGRTTLTMRRVDLTGAKKTEAERKQDVLDKFAVDDEADSIDIDE